jgi:phenylpropionate dioxygenase-like ring-hydroxylating dioxygenase large terminal subunit
VRVRRYPVREAQGNVWIYMGEEGDGQDEASLPPVPEVAEMGDAVYKMVRTVRFPCHMDHAVVGLMDPAHGPFVHQAWWWRSRRSIHQKAKRFAPSDLGFTMLRHAPSKNAFLYRLMGGAPETEIRFQLPGIRIEQVRAGDKLVCGLTAVTPVSETETDVHHAVYWNIPWLTALRPLGKLVAKLFIDQDRRVVAMQQEGLRHDPKLMLINDADTQAKWYHQLKREFARARAEDRPFRHPVPETTLRWRS